MKTWKRKGLITACLAGTLSLGAIGCESNAGSGALIGGAAGAGLGGLIGSYSHARAGEGALIGGAIGAASGALIGNDMDRQERDDYHRYSQYREDDSPREYHTYRYHHYDRDDGYYDAPPPRCEYQVYRETRYYGR